MNSNNNWKFSFRDMLFESQLKKQQEEAEVQTTYDIATYFITNVIMGCNTLDQLGCAKSWGLRLVKDNAEMSIIVSMIVDKQYSKLLNGGNFNEENIV